MCYLWRRTEISELSRGLPERLDLISLMNAQRETVVAALVTAGVAVIATELLRRLIWQDREEESAPSSLTAGKFGRELLRDEFAIRPGYAYCNSGSFGHVPQRIIQEQLKHVRARESDPDAWFRFPEGERSKYFDSVRQLSDFVGADRNNVVLVENTSFGINTALRSVQYSPGDKVLVNSHTYGAILNTVRQVVKDTPGLEMASFDLKVPIRVESDLVQQYERAITDSPGVRVLLLDYISSASAIMTPLRPIIDLCHRSGITVIVDGAHAPGQVPLNLEEIGADYFIGNLHKWLFSPRGCALMYVHPKHHDNTTPLVVSWNHNEKTLADRFMPSATRDSTSYLVVPQCIEFHNALGGLEVIYDRNKALATSALEMLAAAWGTEVYPVSEEFRAPFMGLVGIPKVLEDNFNQDEEGDKRLMKRLSEKGAFVAFMPVDGRIWARISAHVWNTIEDFHIVRDLVLEMKDEVSSISQIRF